MNLYERFVYEFRKDTGLSIFTILFMLAFLYLFLKSYGGFD